MTCDHGIPIDRYCAGCELDVYDLTEGTTALAGRWLTVTAIVAAIVAALLAAVLIVTWRKA
jgi:NADH:ubiquinone oxidoreductase subunit B-like Fe-S oxidoreductase